MAVSDPYVFPGFLTPVLTQLFFPMPPTTFLTCFCRGKRQKYAGKKSHVNQGSNSQPPGHESDMLTTEPPGRGQNFENPPRWLSGVSVRLLTWWFRVQYQVEANFLVYFHLSPLKHVRKVVGGSGKKVVLVLV